LSRPARFVGRPGRVFTDRTRSDFVKPATKKKMDAYSKRLQLRMGQSGVGAGFTDFLKFLAELMPIIFGMPCFAKAGDEDDLAAEMTNAYRTARKKRKNCCPRRVRKLMEKHGCTDPDEQDTAWLKILEEGFVDDMKVAKDLCGVEDEDFSE
jgi:hypothetical protein